MVYNKEIQAQLGKWTFEDRDHLLSDILYSDTFEPSLGTNGGLIELICKTKKEKEEENKRVLAIFKLRDAIKAYYDSTIHS